MLKNFALTLVATAVLPMMGQAQSLEHVEILTGWKTNQGTVIAGLDMTLSEGWKTYWRSPGAAGFPPEIDFSDSSNIKSAKILWPKPDLFGASGFETLGYKGRVTLPIEIVPYTASQPINLNIRGNIGICQDICVPVQFDRSHTLASENTVRHPKIVAALAQIPWTMAEMEQDPIQCKFSAADGGLGVTIIADVPSLGFWERVVIEYPDPEVWFETQTLPRTGNQISARAIMSKHNTAPSGIDRSQFVIGLIGSDMSIEQTGCQ